MSVPAGNDVVDDENQDSHQPADDGTHDNEAVVNNDHHQARNEVGALGTAITATTGQSLGNAEGSDASANAESHTRPIGSPHRGVTSR